jgi:two-component system chemotaxis sensor kinase CheA
MDSIEVIKQGYFQECEELLLAMEEGLIAMDSGEADAETINAVFRAVHSIKGGGGAFGLTQLVGFAHGFETVLDNIRSGSLSPDPDCVKILLRAGDVLADYVNAARGGRALASDYAADVVEGLTALAGGGGGEEELEEDPFTNIGFTPLTLDIDEPQADTRPGGWRIWFKPTGRLYAKANEPLLILRELASLGPTEVTSDISRIPPLEAFDPDGSYVGWTILLNADVPRERVEEAFEFVHDDCELDIQPITPAAPQPLPFEEIQPSPPAAAAPTTPVAAEPAAKGDAAAAPGAPSPAEAPKQTIRVDLDKVDRLVNLVGELVITQAMLSQSVSESGLARTSTVGNGLAELEHLLRELQEGVMAIRTQPVKSVFQRMPRLVRELSAQTQKQVHLVLEGETTEVDKTVIEKLGEPLTHMIRNAVDHGLEAPDDRVAAGKPAEGTVKLSAEHRGGRIVIEVSDDGRGINRARVREKAVEKGLIPASAVLSDEELDNLIFKPGFSTAGQVSNISGRGVGMDVVRRSIMDLGGRIVISSNPGSGSRFSLTLPLTLAVLDGMVVAVGEQTFVLPLTHIVESLKPREQDIRPFGRDRTLLKVRDTYVPLVNVGALLGVAGADADPWCGVVILVESEGCGRLALAVDQILGQRQVVIKSFETNYRNIEGIAAATILGDGRVALILDVDGIVSRCRRQVGESDVQEIAATGTGP